MGTKALITDSPHALLDGVVHSDTAADAVTRGSLIIGNSTPAWDELVIGAADRALVSDGTDPAWAQLDHGLGLSGLTDDDHSQYLLLAGRSGGQTLHGGTGSGDNLIFQTTSHATKGIHFFEEADAVELVSGTSGMELRLREPSGGGTSYVGFVAPALAANTIYTLPSADGSEDQVLRTDGALALSWASLAGMQSVQVFTSSGTWTRPAGITRVMMWVQGAGGGGGATDTTVAGEASEGAGGGGGGFACLFLDVSGISSSTITIGAGGAGGTVPNNTGSTGGDSSWADGINTVTGSGGLGGIGMAAGTANSAPAGGDGGAATGGDFNLPGDAGFRSMRLSVAGAGVRNLRGDGGASFMGGRTLEPANVVGATGKLYGGGGSGASIDANRTEVAGGPGAAGIVVVWEF